MMRKRENPHHSIWATMLVWRCATYKPYSCSHAAEKQGFARHLQTLFSSVASVESRAAYFSCSHAAKK